MNGLKTFRRILILFFLFFAAAEILAQTEQYALPVDEAKKDGSFVAFRGKLIKAVRSRDRKFVLGILDRKILNNFGGDGGVEEFKKQWEFDSPTSEFWDAMLDVITDGGGFIDKNMFAAPYTFVAYPENVEVSDYEMITGSRVNLRSRPTAASELIAQLSYNIVKVDYENSIKKPGEEDDYSWLKVETFGGKKGFVSAEYVRSPLAWRAIFKRIGGKWKMTAFVSGD